tara:strand:+ start:1950 stop:3539 length:1590 start_codon:yes stop_codon:yes gene_type:complete
MYKARERYDQLSSDRTEFLDMAVRCSELTLPYLIHDDNVYTHNRKNINKPFQSTGAKCCTTLAAKLMLALLPVQTTFFKLQIKNDKIGTEIDPQIKSELDLSFSKIERTIMDYIAASNDRVVLHQALKHLIVGGNSLIFMGKEGLKNFPLSRYVVNRDGNGKWLECVTKELISRKLLEDKLPPKKTNTGIDESKNRNDDVEVYTCIKYDAQGKRYTWHQEAEDVILSGSQSAAPEDANPWLLLTFNHTDGEPYGRSRVEEFIGDFETLDALTQALVEGSAAAAKVIFLLNPASPLKPQNLSLSGNGAIVSGRPEDIGVVTVGKTQDFSTAAQQIANIEKRLNEAFLVYTQRQAERVTAEEIRTTQFLLEQQLGGLFSLLTTQFLKPYLSRILLVLTRSGQIPDLPKDLVQPQIVAGINALGRGSDAQQLTTFMGTIAQTVGPEALMKYINPQEAIKRLAAAQGIDVLNLVKTPEQMQSEKQEQMEMMTNKSLVDQAGQLAGTPVLDPSKNPEALETINQVTQGALSPQE